MRRIITIIWIILFCSWLQSCIKLANCDFKPSYKAEVMYGIGVVVGIPFGWFNFGK